MTTWVLLRGLMREARHWGEFPQLLARTTGEQVVTLDFPGNGRLHAQASCTRVADMVEHVRAALQQGGHAPPYRVLALSLGAMAAVAWSEQHADEIEYMVLLNTSMAPFNPFYQRLRPRHYAQLLGVLLLGSLAQRERLILRLTSNLPSSAQRQIILQQWQGYVRECPVSRLNMLRQLVAAARFHASLTAPAVPVLLLAGQQDHLVDPKCSRTLASQWQCGLREHPVAGHDLALDDAEWVVQQVQSWLLEQS
jgi:pimeloyl-ACP methyl ester carboxylesterase